MVQIFIFFEMESIMPYSKSIQINEYFFKFRDEQQFSIKKEPKKACNGQISHFFLLWIVYCQPQAVSRLMAWKWPFFNKITKNKAKIWLWAVNITIIYMNIMFHVWGVSRLLGYTYSSKSRKVQVNYTIQMPKICHFWPKKGLKYPKLPYFSYGSCEPCKLCWGKVGVLPILFLSGPSL